MTKITHSTSQGYLSQKPYSTLFGVAIYANTITSPTLHRSVQKNTLTNYNHLRFRNTSATTNPEDCGNSKFLSSSIFWASMSWRRGGRQKGNGPERDVWSVTDHDPCGGRWQLIKTRESNRRETAFPQSGADNFCIERHLLLQRGDEFLKISTTRKHRRVKFLGWYIETNFRLQTTFWQP